MTIIAGKARAGKCCRAAQLRADFFWSKFRQAKAALDSAEVSKSLTLCVVVLFCNNEFYNSHELALFAVEAQVVGHMYTQHGRVILLCSAKFS